MKAHVLRKKYPRFFYRGYSYKIEGGDLKISFDFAVPPDIRFHPKVVVKKVKQKDLARINRKTLENLIFHLGLMEIPSYWKTTCSPEIVVEAGHLDAKQIRWWKDLILNGMGEYFYKNKIDFTKPDFLAITSTGSYPRLNLETPRLSLCDKALVPVGGGKDAVVTLELLKRGEQDVIPFLLNPKKEQEEILKIAGLKNPIIAIRTIDPRLLQLNRKGYLNGHTPFSAYLAFLSVLCATLFDIKYIALSNERSSNEGNVRYLGKTINHQYSKSFEFEKRFRSYVKTYLAKGMEYFSFLRPLYELQIAKIFAHYPKYFGAFLSCNEAHKTTSGTRKPTGKWCGQCAKCLFVFVALYPFIKERALVKIFHANLFENKSLVPLMKELTGEQSFKPFECVGTTQESLTAFLLSTEKSREKLPPVLRYFKINIIPKHPKLQKREADVTCSWNNCHALPLQFLKLIKTDSCTSY